MKKNKSIDVKKGQRLKVNYENRDFELIVIEPDGLGKNQPSLGFGLRMAEKHIGLKNNTLSGWIYETTESEFEGARDFEVKFLKTPTDKLFRVLEFLGLDNNPYYVLEISQWVIVAQESIRTKGVKKSRQVSDAVKDKVIDFLGWFAIKGLYADAYTILKGIYTNSDNDVLSNWLSMRLSGIPIRKKYTSFLASKGCRESSEYSYWTNCVYEGLFGKTADEMRTFWSLIDGNSKIGRNYIPEEKGLKAVKYCEEMIEKLYIDDLQQAHNDAIFYALKKFSFLKELQQDSLLF